MKLLNFNPKLKEKKMNKKLVMQSLLSLLAFLFLFGCAAKEPAGFSAFTAKQFDLNQYESSVDNFLVIMDASSSMRHDYNGNTKFDTAKTVVERLNMTFRNWVRPPASDPLAIILLYPETKPNCYTA
jgi:hypothetical protein